MNGKCFQRHRCLLGRAERSARPRGEKVPWTFRRNTSGVARTGRPAEQTDSKGVQKFDRPLLSAIFDFSFDLLRYKHTRAVLFSRQSDRNFLPGQGQFQSSKLVKSRKRPICLRRTGMSHTLVPSIAVASDTRSSAVSRRLNAPRARDSGVE